MANTKSLWDNFVNQYSLQKTLRFELKPVGKTLEYIQKRGLIEKDEQREKDFNAIKRILDDYYKYFIEEALAEVRIDSRLLENYKRVYTKAKRDRNKKLKQELTTIQKELRDKIYSELEKKNEFKIISDKQKIKDFLSIVKKWLESNNRNGDLNLINKFDKWTTYFVGFFDNRKNVFSKKEISTSIIYRIVHDNLPRFIDNLENFEEIKRLKGFDFRSMERTFKEYLDGMTLARFFSLENFNNLLTQRGIEWFNTIIGGVSEENRVKLKGLNELINEFSQKQTDDNEKRRIKRLKLLPLYKQILSDRETASFVLEEIKNDEQLMQKINEFYRNMKGKFSETKKLLGDVSNADLDKIYLRNDKSLTVISNELFGDWNIITLALSKYAEKEVGLRGNKLKDWVKKQEYVSVATIEKGLAILKEVDYHDLEISEHPICDYLSSLKKKGTPLIRDIEDKYVSFKKVRYSDNRELLLQKREKDVEKIKNFLDALLELFHFLKPLDVVLRRHAAGKEKSAYDIDAGFYAEFNRIFESVSDIIPLYNKARNYITQKPFSTKKFKLNFENSNFLTGWSSEFGTKSVLIFRELKDEKVAYFLGIIEKKLSKDEVDVLFKSSNNSTFELLNYDFQKPDNKNVPRLFIRSKGRTFSPAVTKYNLPVNDILDIYDNGYFRTEYASVDKVKFKNSLIKIIDYFKLGFKRHESYKHYNFKWKASHLYDNISDFYHDVEISCYQLSFKKINLENLLRMVSSGKIYLFQIWNKDFSRYSHGKKNLHTIYWENLFSEENLKDVVYKLNGEAEMFYRRKSIPRKVEHPKGSWIDNKNPINGKERSKFPYDLIKDRRYTEDKFFFHCPITLNFKARGSGKDMHKRINQHIRRNPDKIRVLGIDRGERNLIYCTLLNFEGNILFQKSFNVISDDLKRKLDYLRKLEGIEGKRYEARKNWKKLANIKELKEGYLSHVVHKIARLAVESNAIIVLEDLNSGFKRSRLKIERQIYQKFEKMLIEKLNYLVFKERKGRESGGPLSAYQLTNKFESFAKTGKQSGIMFYVPAAFTSITCPRTGFVNLLRPRFENVKKSLNFFESFDEIRFVSRENMFRFSFKYSKMKKDEKIKLAKDEWAVYTNGTRLVGFKSKDENYKWKVKEVNLTAELKALLQKYGVDYASGGDLRKNIAQQTSADFFRRLTELLRYTLQLRNSDTHSGKDYILSCVKDKNGEFFDSRNAKDTEPKNADANGAYHIAIKGLIALEKIRKSNDDKADLKISRDEFINYVLKMRW